MWALYRGVNIIEINSTDLVISRRSPRLLLSPPGLWWLINLSAHIFYISLEPKSNSIYWVHRPPNYVSQERTKRPQIQYIVGFKWPLMCFFNQPSIVSIIKCSVNTIPPRACAPKAPQSYYSHRKRTIYETRVWIDFGAGIPCSFCTVLGDGASDG